MGYEAAISKSWQDLAQLDPDKFLSVRFFADEYTVDLENKKVLSLSCNAAAKDFTAILILHYLAQRIKGLPVLNNEWLTFRELSGVEGYVGAFRKRAIEPVISKYGKNPDALFGALDRLGGKRAQGADVAIAISVFEGVPVLVKLWRADEEFGPEANMFFDKSITGIFCTEDIVVLAGFVAGNL